MQRGIAASEAGDKDGAYAIFRQVAEEHPGSADVWVWLGWSSPDMDESEAAFRRALEIDPDSQEAALGLQWVSSERGTAGVLPSVQTPSEGQHISGSLSTGPVMISGPLPPIAETGGDERSLNDLMQLGIAAAQAGDKTTANVTFQSAVERYPKVPEAWVWLAGTATGLDEAEHAFKTASDLDPSNQEALLGLRWVALRRRATGTPAMEDASVSGTLKPYDSGPLSARDLPAEKAAPSAIVQFLKQPAFIFGLLIALSILVIVLFMIRRGG